MRVEECHFDPPYPTSVEFVLSFGTNLKPAGSRSKIAVEPKRSTLRHGFGKSSKWGRLSRFHFESAATEALSNTKSMSAV